ncbi:hypothetical protein SAMN04488168_11396 [Bacillus sp. 491mf]|uniref:hypothetical protein n=1 Tax=Bacillus sp. 491mf TaxID=1761755 RepID=UPI0008E06009|nr:hypothetical protein [Bacillus sp. 491mf]SFC97759.1 hypothetical protein SAMN04488168_11396 [Bacillus sp. 491mf]
MKQKVILAIACILQIFFVVTFVLLLSPSYEKEMDIILTAVGTLFLVFSSFGLSVYSFARRWYPKLSFLLIVTSCMFLAYFILAFILPEAGIPPYLCHRFVER